jgi:outer membrane protein TolC
MDTLDLNALVQEALERNPKLAAYRHQTDATRTTIDQVSALEAPEVGIEFFQIPVSSFPVLVKDNMETDYFVRQMFPWPGKLKAMGSAARNATSMMERETDAFANRLLRDIRIAYSELYFIQRKIQINRENQVLMKQFIDAAVRQFEVGMVRQSDIVRAQTEWSSLVNEAEELRKEKVEAEAMINALLDRETERPLGPIADLYPTKTEWDFDSVSKLAVTNRPELQGMAFGVRMYEAEIQASKKERFPDIMVEGQYKDMTNTGKDFWSVMVGVTVPVSWWSRGRYNGKVAENRLKKMKAESELKDMQNMVLQDVRTSLATLETSYHHYELYRTTIIPQALHALNLIITEYQSGKTEFLMLLDAYRTVLMAKLDYHMAIMNHEKSMAMIEQAVGLSIDRINHELKTR